MVIRPEDMRPEDFPVQPRLLGEYPEVEPLLALCTKGKLY